MNPLVTVITPCYNGAAYIADCIESVLAQTWQNWEMIIVDDCSNDNSHEIVDSYAKRDGRIKYMRTERPSGSPAAPRNIGIEHARGDYIAFLDCDDLWLPRKLEEQIDFAERHSCDFVYSDYEKIDRNATRGGRVVKVRSKSSYSDLLKSCSIPCLTACVRRSMIGNVRFKHIPKEDYAFWLDILRNGRTAYNTGAIHALYRELPVSRSSNKFAMIKQQWFILRHIERIGAFAALYFMGVYIVMGFRKYIV